MRKVLGGVLIAFGLLSIVNVAAPNAPSAPDLPSLVGSFLPGIFFLIFGLAVLGGRGAAVTSVAHHTPESAGGGMRKVLGAVCIAIGLFSFMMVAVGSARSGPDLPGLVGSFFLGISFLIFGLALLGRRRAAVTRVAHAAPESAGGGCETQEPGARAVSLLESRANFGVLGGIVITLLGGAIVRQSRELLLLGLPVWLGGWALFIWGCANYMRWKGYSGWFGLFGLLLLPGLVILACFPNRRKRGLSDGTKSIGSAF